MYLDSIQFLLTDPFHMGYCPVNSHTNVRYFQMAPQYSHLYRTVKINCGTNIKYDSEMSVASPNNTNGYVYIL